MRVKEEVTLLKIKFYGRPGVDRTFYNSTTQGAYSTRYAWSKHALI